MMIQNDSRREILREGGKRLSQVLRATCDAVKPGVSTQELDTIARQEMKRLDGVPAFLGYTPDGARRPYPAALCTSVNEEVVHGIPNESPRILKEGDIVTLDSGLVYEGCITDMAITVEVGSVDDSVQKLVAAAREALTSALEVARAGNTTGDIGHVVAGVASRYGYSTPHELGGHGVGNAVHEEPFIPNFGEPGDGTKLKAGMVLAIEPIVIAGKRMLKLLSDGYTYVTRDLSLSAQFEHTVIITEDAPEIMTVV